jgi:hypothetical protein
MAARLSTAKRFSIAYFALAALVGVGIGTFVLLVERPAPLRLPWSTWQPTASDKLVRAQEIGTHVAAQYHLPSGKRLVRVVVGGPERGTASPIEVVAIAKTTKPTQQSDVLSLFPATGSIMYILCGDGPKCAINEGKSSVARGAVLKREALELALYTFRYVKGITSVVAFSPPKKGESMSLALFFDKSSYSTQLDRPLHKTLVVRPAAVRLAPAERKTVDLLTQRRVLYYALLQENGQRILVLAPKLG